MSNVIYTYENGVQSSTEKEKAKILAKVLHNEQTNVYSYYVLCTGGTLYNPYTAGLFYDRPHHGWKLTKVTQAIYDLYLSFLKSKKQSTLKQAERLI